MIDIWQEYHEDVVACGRHHCIGVDYVIDRDTMMVNIVFHYHDDPQIASSSFHQITEDGMKSETFESNTLMKMILINEAKSVTAKIAKILEEHRS